MFALYSYSILNCWSYQGTAKIAKVQARRPGRGHGSEPQAEHRQRGTATPGGVAARGADIQERPDVQLGEPGAHPSAGKCSTVPSLITIWVTIYCNCLTLKKMYYFFTIFMSIFNFEVFKTGFKWGIAPLIWAPIFISVCKLKCWDANWDPKLYCWPLYRSSTPPWTRGSACSCTSRWTRCWKPTTNQIQSGLYQGSPRNSSMKLLDRLAKEKHQTRKE